jgi:hypothetical protein
VSTDFEAGHVLLKAILTSQVSNDLVVTKDGPAGLALEFRGLEGKPWGYVGGTRLGKSYVSYDLMPVYGDPALASTISPAAREAAPGQACFNFTKIDEALLTELPALTARSIPGWREQADELIRQRSR